MLFSFLSLALSAQEAVDLERPPLRFYQTQTAQKLIEARPEVLEERSQIERTTEKEEKFALPQQVTLPIVFHIIYAPGQTYPQEAQVAAQIEALNRDFSAGEYRADRASSFTADMERKVADTEISFCVPRDAPSGKKTNGINFVLTSVAQWGLEDEMKNTNTGGASPWPVESFLNVWVVNLADSVSGWAQMPGGPAATDGIVIDWRFFGSGGTVVTPYNEGKTLTHLIGNYLNLFDLWDETNRCGDDYVDDTPVHNGPNYDCFTGEQHVSLCHDNPVEMTMNFMDNTPDACAYLFTIGQKQRMQATLAEGGPRAGLVNDNVECATISAKSYANEVAVVAPATPPLSTLTIAAPVVNVFPNPATELVNLVVTLPEATAVQLVVYNTLGKLVYQADMDANAGTEKFSFQAVTWPAGAYYVHFRAGDYQFTERLVVHPGQIK